MSSSVGIFHIKILFWFLIPPSVLSSIALFAYRYLSLIKKFKIYFKLGVVVRVFSVDFLFGQFRVLFNYIDLRSG